jgi:heparin/heparan-sulfate lyase
LWNESGGVKGRLDVALLHPAATDRTLEIVSGPEVHRVDGKLYTPPTPAGPRRTAIASCSRRKRRGRTTGFSRFCRPATPSRCPSSTANCRAAFVVRIADRVVVLAKGTEPIREAFELAVPADGTTRQVVLAGLAPGTWQIGADGEAARTVVVAAGKNTATFASPGGHYRIAPR